MSTQYKLTKEQVEASLIPEMSSKGWMQLISVGQSIPITEETISKAYEDLLKIRAAYEWLEDRLEEENKEDKERIDTRKAGYAPVMGEIKKMLALAEPKFIELNNSILIREKAIGDSIKEQNEIRQKCMDFVNEITKRIVSTRDKVELAKIQMRIGTEKSNRSSYKDYADMISATCNKLLELVEERKDFVKQNASLIKELAKAEAKNDMPLASQIKEEIQNHQRVMEENADSIAKDAFSQVSSIQILNNDLISAAIKPRLHRLSYEVEDIGKLEKFNPELVEKAPNKKAIGAYIKQKEQEGEVKELEPLFIHGLKIFYKPFFVEIKN